MIIMNNFTSINIKVIFLLLIQDYNDVFLNIIKLIQIVYYIFFSDVKYKYGFSK
jgi:hypothetical protein